MSAPFVIAVPAKGRLQENAERFFARAGLELIKPRGARDYRGTIAGVSGVEVAYLSAAEITELLGQGMVHFAGTGELIVDITTTGATLAANALKVVDDGVILRSQANLVAARAATWGESERAAARLVLDRLA